MKVIEFIRYLESLDCNDYELKLGFMEYSDNHAFPNYVKFSLEDIKNDTDIGYSDKVVGINFERINV